MDALDKIEHIVVLMLENRSFDHMLGYLSLPPEQGGRGRNDVDGLTGNETNTFQGQPYPVFHLQDYDRGGVTYPATSIIYDPPHGSTAVHAQINDRAGGFVSTFVDYARPDSAHNGMVMGYYTADEVPVFDLLATEYGVCDRWFCSLPGPTWPNRLFSLTGTSDNEVDNDIRFYDLLTVFDQLRDGVDWAYYYDDFPMLSTIRKYAFDLVNPLGHTRHISQFYECAQAGDLPAVCWIDPRYSVEAIHLQGNDDHPPADIRNGQQLVADVYNALLNGGDNLWEKTLLIVTYDEHGGFYDHVDPRGFDPANPSDTQASATAADSGIGQIIKILWGLFLSLFGIVDNGGGAGPANQYGVRVPALLASPWIDAGTVSHTVFDHTSIIKTILTRFGKTEVDMGPRVASANDLSAVLNRATAREDRPPAPTVDSQLGQPRPDTTGQAQGVTAKMTDLQALIRAHQKLLDAAQKT